MGKKVDVDWKIGGMCDTSARPLDDLSMRNGTWGPHRVRLLRHPNPRSSARGGSTIGRTTWVSTRAATYLSYVERMSAIDSAIGSGRRSVRDWPTCSSVEVWRDHE